MTSDRPAGQPLVAPSSSNNLNPTAPVFCRGGQDKGPQNAFSADVSEKEFSKEFKDLNLGQPLTNGDVHTSGAGNYFAGSPRAWVNQPFQPRMHTQGGTPQGGQAVPGALNMGHAPMAAGQANQANGHQSYSNANSMGLPAEAAANTSRQNADGAGGEPSEGQGPSSAGGGAIVNGDADSGGAGNGSAEAEAPAEEELQYPEELIAPIRKQLEYYFSPENLPHDKYLNTHMDINKYVPLKLFPDFNRMKPICSGIDQLVQAVHTSGLLELNDDRTKVRISQTRKTLTLRGLPPKAIEEDIHKLLRDNDCPPAQHIEIISIHTVSNWYASFPTEDLCMEAFFKLHNNQITVDGYPLGCCIKSSGTHVATGYFPPQEEHRERRIPQSQAPSVAATVQGSITQQPAMQQPPALMQQYNHVQLHPGLMASAHQSLYFSQNPQYLNMQYMPGMITQSWPGTAGLDPGLMLQSSGLQPQHIRTPTMPRPMVQGQASHRFQRPQRINNRQNNVPQVSVSGNSSRNSPATGLDGQHGQVPASIVSHGPSHITRRTANLREEIAATQHAASAGQYITPIVTQHQVTGVPSTTAIVNNPSSVLEGAGISNTAPSLPHNAVNVAAHPTMPQAVQQSQSHSHPQSVLIQQTAMAGGVGNTPTSNPLPQPLHQHHHHQPHHHHHHHQPPPPPPQIPHQLQQQQPPQPTQQHNHPHHHHQQHQQSHHHHPHHHSHHHSIGNNSHHQGQQQHIGGHHQQQQAPPPSAPHQHQQSLHAQHGHHHHHQQHHHNHPPHHHHPHHHQHQQTHHGMVPPQHQHHQPPPSERRSLVMPPQQPPPPQPHHHQQSAPLGNRRNRRRREDTTNRNQRERNPVNRTNFSSQAPAAADNFTMEANSFPPLPGAANAPSSEITPENRMMHSDIVKGINRVPSIGTAAAPLPARGNSSSTTPSPVATPTLTPSHVPSPSGPAMVVDVQGGDDIDSMVEDDATSSSQEEAEADVSNVEPVSRQGRSDISAAPTPDVAPMPVQSRQIHPSGGSNNRQVHNLAQAKTPQHQHHQPQPTVSLQQSPSPQSNAPALSPGNAPASSEAPKLSYAQILNAQKKAANNAAAESNANAVAAAPNNVAPPCSTAPGAAASAAATINGPANNQTGALPASQPNSGNGRMGQANNAFREQGNYPPNPGHRPVSHRLPKDGQTRPEGPQSRLPNGRRNSKENRTQGPPGKFQDRKKPDGRPK